MTEEIKRVVETTYISKNFEYFISRCREKIGFIEELSAAVQDKSDKADVWDLPDDPCVEVHFDVCGYSQNGFKVRYKSVLMISKIVDVYCLQHEFEADNPDPESMGGVLDGFGGEAYCRRQFDLDSAVCDFMTAKGFKRLTCADMDEVIPGVIMPENALFGTQMTVEYAVFKDLWGLCSDDGEE